MTTDHNREQNNITKECIFEAMMLIMEKKHFVDISVTEIAQKAGVSRMAYYRNYSYKEEVITDYLNKLFDDFFLQLQKAEKFGQHHVAGLYFDYCKDQERIVNNLIKSNMTYLLEDRFTLILPLIIEKDRSGKMNEMDNMDFMIEFVAGGLYRLTVQWIKRGMKESSAEMVEILSRIIQ